MHLELCTHLCHQQLSLWWPYDLFLFSGIIFAEILKNSSLCSFIMWHYCLITSLTYWLPLFLTVFSRQHCRKRVTAVLSRIAIDWKLYWDHAIKYWVKLAKIHITRTKNRKGSGLKLSQCDKTTILSWCKQW